MPSFTVRAPAPPERGQARVFVGDWATGTRMHERALEIVGEALDAPGPEGELLGAYEGASLRGVVVFGLVSGAQGAGRLILLAAEAGDVALALAAEAARQLAARNARLVVAEWSDEPPLAQAAAWLRDAGWTEGGRLGDLVSDGVDTVILLAPRLRA